MENEERSRDIKFLNYIEKLTLLTYLKAIFNIVSLINPKTYNI